ncbi:MAG: response regulator transcription factor [Clostridium sp.]|nr:response regulator transcription factor [Clostridium sp.]
MKTILIIEDDVNLCGGVKLYLEKKGYQVLCAHSLHEARRITDKGAETIALMLLDCNLPDGDGMEFCRNWRQRQAVPVIFLTARDTEEDMIRGFRAGADDYMAKPFSVELLSERIAAVLRRSAGEEDRQMFCYRGLAVDLGKKQVFREQEPVKLSGTEYRILELLIDNRSQVMTREMLLQKIWDIDENYVDENTLNVYIRRLRRKLEKDPKNPEYIITVFGIGYTFGDM